MRRNRVSSITPTALFPTLLCLLLFSSAAMAQPVGSVDLMFSSDDGATFNDVATVDDMQNLLVRLYFDNTGDQAGMAASLSTSLPAGFSLVAGTTRVCLEPEDGVTVCNEDVGQSGAIDESSVWAGGALTISPTAGLFGESIGLTSGVLEIGKSRYFNLHECQYFNGVERFLASADPDIAGTNISDTIDAAAACAGVVGAYGLAGQGLRTTDLLALRYLNLHECHYNFLTDHIYLVTDGTATRTSNDVDAAFNCAGTAGAHILHPDSAVTNLDLFGQRYLNFWECRYINAGDLISVAAGTNTSNTPDAAPNCPATTGAYTLNDSDHLALDTLDTTRGRGFVEAEIFVNAGAGDFDFDVTLAANEFADETDMGTVTVISNIPVVNPSVDLKFSRDCGQTFDEDFAPSPGENVITRIYFDNTGDLDGTGAQIATTLPNGVNLVPGSTRVCFEPGPGELVCNTDMGQGGAIDEAAVWNGADLSIAPNAGLAGESADSTFGLLPTGRKRYLNLHECHYYDGFNDRLFLGLNQGASGTNISNSMDMDAICQPMAHGGTLVSGLVSSFDMLGAGYFNIHECQYSFFLFDRIFLQGMDFTGTNFSGIQDLDLSCAPAAGAHTLLPAESHLTSLDLAQSRYLNLHECVMINGTDHIGLLAGGGNGTNASNDEDTLVVCPSTSGAHTLVTGTVAALDMLDATRARGFVEFQVTADNLIADAIQTVSLSGNEFTAVDDMGNAQSTPNILFKNGFECGTTEKWDEEIIKSAF